MRKLLLPSLLFLKGFLLQAQNGSWTVFNPVPQVSCLSARGNTIIAGSVGAGIAQFDTLNNRTNWNTGNSDLPSDSIFLTEIDQNGNWWMHYPGGICRFDGATVTTWSLVQTGLPATASVRAMKTAPDGSLWLATDNGLTYHQNGAWTTLNSGNSGIVSNNIWDLEFSPDGKRYFATAGSGVVIQDGTTWTTYSSANTGITFMNNVYSIVYTADSSIWILSGIQPSTLVRLIRFKGGVWTSIPPSSIGLPTPITLHDLLTDANQQLWLSTKSTLSTLVDGVWTLYPADSTGCSISGVKPVADGAGAIWAGTYCDLARLNAGEWERLKAGFPGPAYGTLWNGVGEGPDGSIWIGVETDGFITRFDGDTWTPYNPLDYGATRTNVYSVQADPDGQMWFGLDYGEILRFSNGNWTLFDTCRVNYATGVIYSATAPNGDQWFSLIGALAQYTSSGQWHFFDPDNSPVPPGAFMRKILIEPNGVIWVSTANSSKGILRYNGVTWDSITVSNSGLPSNRVFYIEQAPDGAIWACTVAGLARFDGQSWTTYTEANSGLPSNITKRLAFDKAGGMYLGYESNVAGGRVAVFRDNSWTVLIPPGWTNSSYDPPDAFFMDSQNRLWFNKSDDIFGRIYRYDPMLVKVLDAESQPQTLVATPNPTSGILTLQLSETPGKPVQCQVFNTAGQCVYQHIAQAVTSDIITLDMSQWPSGIYWCTVAEGTRFSTVKVVKQ